MTIDFLGTSPQHHVVGESVTVDSDCIILARGFFYMDSFELYDAAGNEIDVNGYSFDLPAVDLSCQSGKMVFGRVLLNTNVVPATVDYRTPHSSDDNRATDISVYHAQSNKNVSTDYYDNSSAMFRSGNNTMDASTVTEWLSELDGLIDIFRNRILGYDIISSEVTKVFNYPASLDGKLNRLRSPSYMGVMGSGNTISVTPTSITWGNLDPKLTIDYSALKGTMLGKVSDVENLIASKLSGSASSMIASLDALSPPTVAYSGTEATDSNLRVISGDLSIVSADYPAHYVGLTAKITNLLSCISASDSIDSKSVDLGKLLRDLRKGYGLGDIDIVNGTIVINGIFLSSIYSKDKFISDLATIGSGGIPTNVNRLRALRDKVDVIGTSLVLPTIATDYQHLGDNITTILDSLCIVRSTMDHGTTGDISLGGIL